MTMLETLLDPQRRAKAQEDQAKLKLVMGQRVARDPAQASYLYGVTRERLALERLGGLADVDVGDPQVVQWLNQLAEGLALQCHFEEAATIAPDGPRREMYASKAKAIENLSVQMCSDPPTRQSGDKQEATQLAADRVWTGKEIVQFTRCLICGAVSAYA